MSFRCTCGHIELDRPGTYECARHGTITIEADHS